MTKENKMAEEVKSRIIIETVEQNLNGYFGEDLEACSELKQEIAKELRKILSSE